MTLAPPHVDNLCDHTGLPDPHCHCARCERYFAVADMEAFTDDLVGWAEKGRLA